MSYTDDEELKIGDLQEEDDDLDLDHGVDDPLEDDLIPEDDEALEGFADLDGSSY